MNAMEMGSMLTALKASPAVITSLINDYRNLSSDKATEADRKVFMLKLYKLAEPVLDAIKNIPGEGKAISSLVVACNDYVNLYDKWGTGQIKAEDYFNAASSTADTISNILYMLPAPQAKAAGLAFQVISGVASYGAVIAHGQGGEYIDPKLSSEREQAIKNHIPSKTDNHDAAEEYYKQAKSLMAKEGGWSLSMDVDITTAMLKQGYDQKSITDTMKRLSPDTAGAQDKEAQAYADYIIDRERKRSQITLKDDSISQTSTPTKIDEIQHSQLAVKDLSRNPDSKSLFNAYAKEVVEKNGQVWTADTNKQIVESMLKDGRTPQRIVEALKQSPEPIANAYYYVKEIANTPEMQQMQKSKSIGI